MDQDLICVEKLSQPGAATPKVIDPNRCVDQDHDARGRRLRTDGTLEAQGEAAEGVLTTLHYADGLNNPKDKAFRAAYSKAYKTEADTYAMQGYDSAQLMAIGIKAVNGDLSKRKEMIAAMASAKLDSPRGAMSFSRAHNPVNDIYLRKVEGKRNKVIDVAMPALADPALGCKM